MNLLPPYQKEEVQRNIRARALFVALGIISFWAVMFLVLLYNSLLYLDLQMPAITERLEAEENTQKTNVVHGIEEEIDLLNDTLAKIDAIREKKTFNFPYILRVAGSIVPEGAVLKDIVFSEGSIAIAGHADLRSQVLKIKENLEKEEIFQDVNSPLSNVVKEGDITFSFKFSIK